MDNTHFSPLAYLLTFHTYGTWLPGDCRGSVRHGDRYGDPYRGPCDALERRSLARLRTPPVVLSLPERIVVRRTFEEVCSHRAWTLHAAHVRTNHVHVVVASTTTPARVLGDLKAWASRRVAEAGHRTRGTRLWASGASMRHLWNEKALAAACFYAVHEQGDILPGTVHSPP